MAKKINGKFSGFISAPGQESIEQATPEKVAMYRASRLKCSVAMDLCCGVGMDAIALARNCKKVYAFDNDSATVECAKNNAKAYGAGNVEFACADSFTVGLKKMRPDIVFADPSRRANGLRVKALGETMPSTLRLIEFIKSQGVKDFCIEASAAISPAELPDECEKEMVSLNKEPNCISLYFGGLKKAEYSFTGIPGGGQKGNNLAPETHRLECGPDRGKIEATQGKWMLKYLHELDEGIVRMGMQKQAHDSLGSLKEKTFPLSENIFGSAQKIASPFFRNSFKALSEINGIDGAVEKLRKLKAGKVVLRGRFGEQDQLWLKESIEEKLEGKRKLHLFFIGKKIIIAENMEFR